MRSLILGLALLANSAFAADGPWTPAPVPGVGDGHVMPADRAGQATGSVHDAPFSGLPVGSVTAGGATSSNAVNGAQTPDLSTK